MAIFQNAHVQATETFSLPVSQASLPLIHLKIAIAVKDLTKQ